jgi:DNA-binding transcriptional ArsR family regulator
MLVDTSDRSNQELLRYVERFALVLRGLGIPPMAARVFAYALAEDSDRYTAGELASALRASPAAISGAVRYLLQTGLLTREREPGTRSDLYVLHDDVWTRVMGAELAALATLGDLLEEGVALVGTDTPGGRRMARSADFFAFLRQEVPKLIGLWRDRQVDDVISG